MKKPTPEQLQAAESIVSYWLQRMMKDAAYFQDCTIEQIWMVLQRRICRVSVREGWKPKDLGRRAEAMARDYKRSRIKKREVNQFNDLAQPCLRLVPTDKE